MKERGWNKQISWKRLFKKFPFFKAYQHFIQIQILSKNQEIHEKWKGFCESKVKRLLKNLEYANNEFNCLELVLSVLEIEPLNSGNISLIDSVVSCCVVSKLYV